MHMTYFVHVCMWQIHTYISTHGTTKRGRDQSHKDDTGEDGHAAPARKCPKILNDWTKAQPHIDKANRWRQRILAIEERFPTNSFPFRLMTTVISGMSIVSAHTMFAYHVAPEYAFRSFVESVAFDAMCSTFTAHTTKTMPRLGVRLLLRGHRLGGRARALATTPPPLLSRPMLLFPYLPLRGG